MNNKPNYSASYDADVGKLIKKLEKLELPRRVLGEAISMIQTLHIDLIALRKQFAVMMGHSKEWEDLAMKLKHEIDHLQKKDRRSVAPRRSSRNRQRPGGRA